jgi:hypothetical protein
MARVSKVRRSPQAVACGKRSAVELGKPRTVPDMGTPEEWYTGNEARMGKPGHGTILKPETLADSHAPGGPETAINPWGVLSGIVLGARESRVHGEGPDGSTPLLKETRAGHAGLEQHEPTSLRGISNRAKESKDHRFQNLNRCLNAEFLRECWQDLNKDAASGVDGVTAAHYQENLESNIRDLAKRLESGSYRAKLIRRCYIPKENGKERPLGIPALEDKLVQLACAKLLDAVFEEDFLEFGYGYRPKRSAKEAVSDLEAFTQALERLGIARPAITEPKRRHRVFA